MYCFNCCRLRKKKSDFTRYTFPLKINKMMNFKEIWGNIYLILWPINIDYSSAKSEGLVLTCMCSFAYWCLLFMAEIQSCFLFFCLKQTTVRLTACLYFNTTTSLAFCSRVVVLKGGYRALQVTSFHLSARLPPVFPHSLGWRFGFLFLFCLHKYAWTAWTLQNLWNTKQILGDPCN